MSSPVRVSLKLATSLDGRIATAQGESKWITGEAARARVHLLRAQHQGVVVGIETAIADDPELTVRTPGHTDAQPARIVLDSRQRLPDSARLVQTAREHPTIVVTISPPEPRLLRHGVKVIQVKSAGDRPELRHALEELAALGLHSLMVEGGGQVSASFLRCELVDQLLWFRAPMVLGAEGRPAVGALSLAQLSRAPKFERTGVEELGPDLFESYRRI